MDRGCADRRHSTGQVSQPEKGLKEIGVVISMDLLMPVAGSLITKANQQVASLLFEMGNIR